ncbi:LPS-assembly protein LptD [Litorivita pollutaquae]|uniref:LPS-assembly protein LptD n=1 Tax=Litorivita pollutaquae TaxID=2200892 RepID=A0A2V4MV77_9RHOB|nr:LPS assembly protein LptD [Litorivita pollutaquae]PYC49339.1 LPS-assembly protein LptD [Litorivita pollutaquae]
MRAGLKTVNAAALAAALATLPVLQPAAATAQDTAAPPAATRTTTQAESAPSAILVADNVFLRDENTLVAEGAVEVLYDTTRLRARKITYLRGEGQLMIEGPVRITETGTVDGEDHDSIIIADSAELDRDLQNGIIRGARLVLDQQLQLAALNMSRANGRYSRLYKASVTSCRVCAADGVARAPLWQIRAESVVHDQDARQLHFTKAQLRVLDFPVLYLPRLRLPDPTQTRATGFLVPSSHSSTLLGFGVRVPYFIKMGDHRDLTLTPYLSRDSRTLEWRYRQSYRNGQIEITGAFSQDSLQDDTRAYLFANGQFALPRDFTLSFDIEAVKDDAYLVDYGYSSKDRLDSDITLNRVRRGEYINAALTNYHTLREDERNATIPSIIADLNYERRLFPSALGGELRLSAGLRHFYRYSDLDYDSTDSDLITDGRDVTQLSATMLWSRDWTLAGGLRLGATGALSFDSFIIAQDSSYPGSTAQMTPTGALRLSYPLEKTTANGTRHVVEPMAQISWTGGEKLNVPNEQSTLNEFDSGNLFSLSRFNATDRRERGTALALGTRWSRYAASGNESTFVLGQVFRDEADSDFTRSSGLSGKTSGILVGSQWRSANGLALTGRGVLDMDLDLSKIEARAEWFKSDAANLSASYVWLGADTVEDRPDTVSEWSIDGSYRIARHWIGSANWRYDVADDRTAEAGIGIQYRNECVDVMLSLSRRFTSSLILAPSTDISFTVGLRGFSTDTIDKSYTRRCKN